MLSLLSNASRNFSHQHCSIQGNSKACFRSKFKTHPEGIDLPCTLFAPSPHPPPHTDGYNILHTPLVKYFNDLLEIESSERGKNEVTYFYVGVVFCIHLRTKYADFQEKIFTEISGKKFQTIIPIYNSSHFGC